MLISDRIPITVGVVGHLDVITTDEQKLQIENLFKDLAVRYPNSPVYLFSSIAEGADRYVANIFLDLKSKNEEYKERFELIVPMPFEKEEYKNDFSDASDREFDELLKQAKRSFPVGYDGKDIDRPQQYLKTGKFVADSSLILIALCYGEAGKKGGTADIVKHKITGDDDTVAESTFEYDGTVFVLPSKRAKSPYQVSPGISNKEDDKTNKLLPHDFKYILCNCIHSPGIYRNFWGILRNKQLPELGAGNYWHFNRSVCFDQSLYPDERL